MMKEIVNENFAYRQQELTPNDSSILRKLTTSMNIDSMILFSGSEFGSGSLVVESWLAV